MGLTRMTVLLTVSTAFCACRSTDDNSATVDARPSSTADAAPASVSVKQFLMGTHTVDSGVNFGNVVVVGRVTTSGDGKIWIQDPGGGAQSGMMLFCDFDSPSQMCEMSGAQVDALEPGDLISVTGKYVRAFGRIDQITTPKWTKKGTKMAPVALTVDAAMVAKDQEASAQSLANVYIKVAGPVTVGNFMADEFKNTGCRPPDMTPDGGVKPDAAAAQTVYDRGFEGTVSGKTLAIGFKFFDSLELCMPSCGYCDAANMLVETDSFASVSGVIYFERGNNINFLEIRPISNADLPKL